VLVNVWSTWRELIVSAAERVVPVPDGVSDEDAAQAIVNPVTPWVLANRRSYKPCSGNLRFPSFAG